MSDRWLILRTRPNFELKLETAVQQIGVPAYVPEIVTKRRHHVDRRRILTLRRAIYPGYAFVREHFPVEMVNTTKLQAHWMRDGEKLAQISDKLMEMIEAGERIGCAIEEAMEVLRCAPLTRRMAKRERFSRDLTAALKRVA